MPKVCRNKFQKLKQCFAARKAAEKQIGFAAKGGFQGKHTKQSRARARKWAAGQYFQSKTFLVKEFRNETFLIQRKAAEKQIGFTAKLSVEKVSYEKLAEQTKPDEK